MRYDCSTLTPPTNRRRRLVFVAAAVIAAACHRGAAHRDIFLISVDTLRPDHLGMYGYGRPTSPHLDERFRHGIVFERAYTTEASTSPSVATILTGLLPQQHRVRLFYQLLGSDVPTIADLLPEDYQTAAFVSNMVLTDEAIGLANRFDHYDDYVARKEPLREKWERNARDTTNAVLAWLATSSDDARPLFLWVHYMDPHGPYSPPDHWKRSFTHEGTRPIDPEQVPVYHRLPGVSDAMVYMDAYDEEIAYADSEIGRLLDGIDKRRGLQDALVLFTADHGESMVEHERAFMHGYHVYDEIARVPLALLAPDAKPQRRSELVSLLDIAPTILRFAGVTPPASMNGADLLASSIPSGRTVFTEATAQFAASLQRRSAVRGYGKWVAEINAKTRKVEKSYYYDLRTDPLELVRRPWPREGTAGRELLRLIQEDPDRGGVPEQYAKGIELKAPKVAPGVSPQVLERLRALGYVR